jgi:glycosyltransferase involved in cell wall biosynthesis
MSQPFVSIVVETISARENCGTTPLPDFLSANLAAIDAQTYPRELRETIVVLDDGIAPETAAELRERYPSVEWAAAPAANYFANKNAGAAVAGGDIIALVDSDCVVAPDWIEMLVARFEPGVVAVAGYTRYTGHSLGARTFSVPDFGYVAGKDEASGFNLSNVAFRRSVLLAHPLDARIRRDGGCYSLFHRLRAEGARILYEGRAIVVHGVDRGGYIRKHFNRGYDGVSVYRLDETATLRGTRLFRRLGALALPPITARRIVVDWIRLVRLRRQMNISLLAVPYYAAVDVMTRLIELAGGLKAAVGR